MKSRGFFLLLIPVLAALACRNSAPASPTPTVDLPEPPADGRTMYGFFPSPPKVSLESVFNLYENLGVHADVVLLQQNIPWEEFAVSADGDSQRIVDIANQHILAAQNGLGVIFVVDPLNGLNRREFYEIPAGWDASFANPQVRAAFTNFTLRVVRQFHPRYLGLASEINTYIDAHPDDAANYISLYNEVYDLVKAEAPETQIFVTFQWEDLNNLVPTASEGRQPYQTNWETIEAFEPRLDAWVISSYPFVVFESGSDIPANYYTPLLEHTTKPLAVAEGGFTSGDVGPFHGDPQDQVGYLNAIHSQLGARLVFWIYLLLMDFNIESYAPIMVLGGHGGDVDTLGMFASVGLAQDDGTPKPALELWDGFRNGR